jgi:hypothetical protein
MILLDRRQTCEWAKACHDKKTPSCSQRSTWVQVTTHDAPVLCFTLECENGLRVPQGNN